MNDSLIKCIKFLYPKAKAGIDFKVFREKNGEIKLAFWNASTLGPLPTLESILSNETEAEAAHQLAICHANRRAEYPSIADYLDGIVKGDQAQVQKYIDECLAVKSKYPKP
jgi:hypothetical protein